jgi:hypothetical protein
VHSREGGWGVSTHFASKLSMEAPSNKKIIFDCYGADLSLGETF